MMRVSCPSCSKALSVPPDKVGKSVKCPGCASVFVVPGQPGAVAAKAVAAKAAKPVPAKSAAKPTAPTKPTSVMDDDEDGKGSYSFGIDEGPKDKEAIKDDRVDDMVVSADRMKRRNRAWDEVGRPALFIKRTALFMLIFWILAYLFTTMIIVLAAHQMEQVEKGGGTAAIKEVKGVSNARVEYLFIEGLFPEIRPQTHRPLHFWLVITAGLITAIAVYGFELAGAESMKRLERYNMVMAAMAIGTISLNLFCIWGLLALVREPVKNQFEITKRRSEGIGGEELYRGLEGKDDEEDEEEEDDEEDEDEDEEEEDEKPKAKKSRR